MQQIQKSKHRLTLTFFSIIIGIILLLGVSFFTYRFIDGYARDTIEARNLSDNPLVTLENLQNEGEAFVPKFPKPLHAGKNGGRHVPIPFAVLFGPEGKVIKKDLGAEYQDDDDIENLFQYSNNELFQNLQGIGRFYNRSYGAKILVFKPFRYSLEEYFEDLLIFVIFLLLFSFPLYLVIKKFVDRAFIPVEESHVEMENFVHNAGHELKTPLSVLHGDLQMMMAKREFDSERITEMMGEIDGLNILIEGLVNLADIQSGSEVENLSVAQEVENVVKTYEKKIHDKHLEIEIKKSDDIFVSANRGYFQILLSNLISNAIKYNKDSGKVFIHITKQQLLIEDSGIGIDEQHHTKIWQRFYKISQNKNGNGIGLSLVKKIADIYGWHITMKSKKGEFTRFTIRF